jgi:hypothetical protein
MLEATSQRPPQRHKKLNAQKEKKEKISLERES